MRCINNNKATAAAALAVATNGPNTSNSIFGFHLTGLLFPQCYLSLLNVAKGLLLEQDLSLFTGPMSLLPTVSVKALTDNKL